MGANLLFKLETVENRLPRIQEMRVGALGSHQNRGGENLHHDGAFYQLNLHLLCLHETPPVSARRQVGLELAKRPENPI